MQTRIIQKLMRVLPCSLSGPLIRRSCRVDRSKADGIVFKIADTREELEAAYRLVHDVYVHEGYQEVHRSGLRVNLRYALPTTTTFIGVHDGEVVITMTLVGDSPLGVPMDAIFSRELYRLRRQGRYIAEVSAFASHPKFRRRGQVLAMFINKIMWTYGKRCLNADDLVIAVNPKHRWVYKTLLMFESISTGVKRYHYVQDAPAIAMRLDLRTTIARWERAYRGIPADKSLCRFFIHERSPEILLPAIAEPYNVWDEEMFHYFFEHMTDPRREGHGSLLDLYRILYALPDIAREGAVPAETVYIEGTEPVAASDF